MTNPLNLVSIVSYCEQRLQPIAINEIIKKGKSAGLSNTAALNKNLKKGCYIPVLNAIWSDKDRRLSWLQSHASELHAPLMFEQAIAEFVNSPTVTTIVEISIPLIQAATFRVNQDSKCSTDPSVFNGDAAPRMRNTYLISLNKQIEKHLGKKLENVLSENQSAIDSAMTAKTLKTAELSLSQKLPSPDWIGSHGINAIRYGKVEMHPIAASNEIRNKFAYETIQHFENLKS